MDIKIRLTILNFLELFVWGAWLISLGAYMSQALGFTGLQIGSVYATMGIASLFMPGLMGIVADRWVNAERVFAFCHLVGAASMLYASTAGDFGTFYFAILLNSLFYMPTIALNNSISYNILVKEGLDVVKHFPPIRVWGTVGFIIAMWVVDLMGWNASVEQLYTSAIASIVLAGYVLTLPPTRPAKAERAAGWMSAMGLDAFVLFKRKQMAIFFIFAMLLGAALQITNAFGQPFLASFKDVYPDSFGVQHPNLLLSISQISETLFILAIPFFLSKFGIKKVMLMSMVAWVLRFALFGLGNPADGLYLLIISMIVYGLAFDFFNISGSLYIENEASPKIRSSAQGLFMIMTNGFGALFGGIASGWVVDYFTVDGVEDWTSIWYTFAAYALLLAIIFPFVFKYKHTPVKAEDIQV